MIQTFQQIWSELQDATEDRSASELVLFKRDANVATQRFKSVMSRPWSRIAKKANTVAGQQDYQLPRSVLRPSGIDFLYGGAYVPLIEIGSEQNWNAINSTISVGIGVPRFFFPKGKDVISVYPIPDENVTEGLKVYYEPKQPRMVSDDFVTGTVTVTQGSTTLTHSGTENYYEGPSGSGKGFVLGVVPDIPDEYHPAITDYCMGRFYLRKGDRKAGIDMLGLFTTSLDECKEVYASPTSYPNIQSPYDMSFNLLDNPPGMLT
jgi:hypothetical protein